MQNKFYSIVTCTIFFSISCYTIVEKNFYKNSNLIYLNHRIIGAWTKKNLWIDYGYRIRRLEFFSDGNVTFYPNWERFNPDFYTGKFTIIKDTLRLKLFNNSFEEIFLYKADNNNLILEKIENEYRLNHKVADQIKEYWVRANK